jgi:hypothetical protein
MTDYTAEGGGDVSVDASTAETATPEASGAGTSDASLLGTVDASDASADVAADAARDAGPYCSGDLQYVLGAGGQILQQCPIDQGCLAGACIDACQAAAAAHGSIGCQFVVSTPSTRLDPPCFAVGLTNVSRDVMQITVSRDGTTFDPTAIGHVIEMLRPAVSDDVGYAALTSAGVPPGETAVLFLSGDPKSVVTDAVALNNGQGGVFISADCPFPKAVDGSTAVYVPLATPIGDHYASDDATGRGKAFTITTSIPAAAVDVLPYDWSLSQQGNKSNLLPVSAWDTRYVATSINPIPSDNPVAFPVPFDGYRPNYTHIIAASDGTTVTITPRNFDLPGGQGVSPAPHGVPTTYTLSAGEFIQWQGVFDMTGSSIESNKPVGLVIGSPYSGYKGSAGSVGTHSVYIGGSSVGAGEGAYAAHAPILPVSGLGSEYVGAAPLELVLESVPIMTGFRLVGVVDGTRLAFDPSPPALAKTTLDAGESLSFAAIAPFRVSSQDAAHPFIALKLGGGCWDPDTSGLCSLSSSYAVPLSPADRWLTSVTSHDLDSVLVSSTFVRRRGPDGLFHPLTAVCRDGTTVGPLACGFQPLGNFSDYQYTAVANQYGGVNSPCDLPVTGCDIVSLSSAAPFMVDVHLEGAGVGVGVAWSPPFAGAGAALAVPGGPAGSSEGGVQ